MMTLSEELQWRGLIQNTTLSDSRLFDQKKEWVFYIGFDASAPSQTVGNLASMMAAQVFLRHGHRAIILAGGATSLIGDPGGKDKERPLQSQKTVAENISLAQKQFQKVFKDYAAQITYVNNLDWFADFKFLNFLRDVGKHFSMTPLIQRDYIASRLGQGGSGISYTEFSYTLMQGYDYLRLFEDHGCELQLGGSDQWGNCLSGVDLIRRKHRAEVDVLALPLIINRATGKKFGKSEEQTVWLDPQLTHPSDFYQFWFNLADEHVLDYLKVFTDLDKPAIEKLGEKQKQEPHRRWPQKALAEAVTRLVHGQADLELCQLLSELAFQKEIDREPAEINRILNQEPADRRIELALDKDDSENNSDKCFDVLLEKIDHLNSRAQIKTLLKDKAIKVVSWESQTATAAKKTQGLEDFLNNFGRSPISANHLLIIGKNTLRLLELVR